jgi:hypothetical protein
MKIFKLVELIDFAFWMVSRFYYGLWNPPLIPAFPPAGGQPPTSLTVSQGLAASRMNLTLYLLK